MSSNKKKNKMERGLTNRHVQVMGGRPLGPMLTHKGL